MQKSIFFLIFVFLGVHALHIAIMDDFNIEKACDHVVGTYSQRTVRDYGFLT